MLSKRKILKKKYVDDLSGLEGPWSQPLVQGTCTIYQASISIQTNLFSNTSCQTSPKNKITRLISIESQPKKIVVVAVVVIGFVIVVVHVVVVFIPVVDPRNIPLKFGSNQVINR